MSPSGSVEPPEGLSDRSQALWRMVLAEYDLSAAETELLRSGLVALDRADQAAVEVDRLGVIVTDRYGSPKANPACDIEARNRTLFRHVVAQLGVKAVAEESPRTRRARAAAQVRWAQG